jgi:hypothetical protein
MINITNITRQMLLASVAVMAATGEARTQTLSEVTPSVQATTRSFAAIVRVPLPHYKGSSFSRRRIPHPKDWDGFCLYGAL